MEPRRCSYCDSSLIYIESRIYYADKSVWSRIWQFIRCKPDIVKRACNKTECILALSRSE